MKIPCGRTEEDKHLCCMRNHKWYNCYWTILKLKRPDFAIEDTSKKTYVWERKCLFCGNRVQLGGHPFEKGGW